MKPTILVVEDDPAIAQMINFHLDQARFQCKFAKDAAEARQHLCESQVSLILMDWMLPGDTTGVELTRELKQSHATRDLPIIMLTARVDEKDKVRGFETGAEDYVTKPFSARELILRIRALLRRTTPHAVDDIVQHGELMMNPAEQKVEISGNVLKLNSTGFRLLHFFLTHPDTIFSRSQLMDSVWGFNNYIEERTVDVQIRRLRNELKRFHAQDCVETVRGAGYRFLSKTPISSPLSD